jgi:hypothetical protein
MPSTPSSPSCPACGAALIEGMEGPVRCAGCGETLYRMGKDLFLHRGAAPVLTMAMAADRLRNHLRRLAIVRLGRIEGDCYLLPFFRMEGKTPEGDETFTVLGASLGEERLERAFLLPADIRRYETPAEGAAGASGAQHAALRVLAPTLPQLLLRARVESVGWSVSRTLELIHYPFWLMRVEDCGRVEGAWMDGIEGKIIHHRMRLSPPLPSRSRVAAVAAIPAAAACAAALAGSGGELSWAAAVWTLAVPVVHTAFLRNWRG